MKFKYVGKCAAGFVEFVKPPNQRIVMPEGEPVEVPDWLAKKLVNNNGFERVAGASAAAAPAGEAAPAEAPKKRAPRKAK